MALAGPLIDLRALVADRRGLAAVPLLRRDEPDGAVAVLMDVPVHECRRPLAGLLLAGKGPTGVVGPVLGRAEQRLGVRVVVRDPGPGERAQHAQLLQPHLQRGGTHGAAVVGVQDQTLLAALADPLLDAGAADQIGGHLGIFPLGDVPGDDLAAPDVDHQVEVQPYATHAGGQVGDVPAPQLIGTIRTPPRHRPRLLRRPGPSAALDLLVGVEHPVEAALGGEEHALIGQVRHDLRRWQRGVLRLVADRQDPLPLLIAQAVRHVARTALAAVTTTTAISTATGVMRGELTPPALQRAQADRHALRHPARRGTGSHGAIEDL